MTLFHLIKSIAQYIAVTSSLLSNTLLIVVVIRKSPKKIGNYKYLMCYFAILSILYASLDFVVQPYLYGYGSTYTMIMNLSGSIFINFPTVAFFLTYFTLFKAKKTDENRLALKKIIFRENRTRYFAGLRLVIWLCIPVIVGIAWLVIGLFLLDYDEEYAEYIGAGVERTYGLNVSEITFTGGMYYRIDEKGNKQWITKDVIGSVLFSTLLIIPFSIICYYGYKIYRTINSITEQGVSDYSRRLQKQLYKALVVQTVIPIIFLFFPIGALFFAPLLHIDLENWSYLITFCFAFYPAVDPIPTIVFVDEYKNGFKSFIRCQKQVDPMFSIEMGQDVS